MRIVLEKPFWGTRTIYVVSKNTHIYHLLSTTSCFSWKCFNHWAIWPNNEICFILILNFPKCFSQNQIRQSFSCSLASQPGSTCAVCSEFLWINDLIFQFSIKNLCIRGVKTSFLNQWIFCALVCRHGW